MDPRAQVVAKAWWDAQTAEHVEEDERLRDRFLWENAPDWLYKKQLNRAQAALDALDAMGEPPILVRYLNTIDDLWANIEHAQIQQLLPDTIEHCKEIHTLLYHQDD